MRLVACDIRLGGLELDWTRVRMHVERGKSPAKVSKSNTSPLLRNGRMVNWIGTGLKSNLDWSIPFGCAVSSLHSPVSTLQSPLSMVIRQGTLYQNILPKGDNIL